MKLLFTRHGQTDWNKSHKAQGQTDNPLNEVGIAQAYDTAKKIGGGYRST